MDASRRLTAAELTLVADRQLFAAKARITGKVTGWLKDVQSRLQADLRGKALLTPPQFDLAKTQFVRGEHLEDHPYQYVDCPKHFADGNTLTIRTLFWWGHHAVIALLVEGEHVLQYKQNFLSRYHQVADHDLMLSLGPDLWEWKSGEGLTLPVTRDRRSEVAAVLGGRTLFKLTRYIPFDDPTIIEARLLDAASTTLQAFLPVIAL